VNISRIFQSFFLRETLGVIRIQHLTRGARSTSSRASPAAATTLSIQGLSCSTSADRGGCLGGSGRRRRRRVAASWRHAHWSLIGRCLAVADTGLPIGGGLTRTGNRLKIDYHIVAKNFTLGHDIKVVAVSIVVCGPNLRTPLLVAIIGAEIGDHDGDTLPSSPSGATAAARGIAS
jgi:hypothetical protein